MAQLLACVHAPHRLHAYLCAMPPLVRERIRLVLAELLLHLDRLLVDPIHDISIDEQLLDLCLVPQQRPEADDLSRHSSPCRQEERTRPRRGEDATDHIVVNDENDQLVRRLEVNLEGLSEIPEQQVGTVRLARVARDHPVTLEERERVDTAPSAVKDYDLDHVRAPLLLDGLAI